MEPVRTETYDVGRHVRARNTMFACWGLMFLFWSFAWMADWLSALCSMLANGFFLLSLYWFLRLYPEKSER